MLGGGRRADDTGDEPEVRGEPIVETVHDIPEEPAGLGSMPRLRALAADARELAGMLRRFTRQQQRLTTTRGASRRLLMQVEVSLYLTALLSKEVRKQKLGSEASAEPREQTGT